MFNGMFENGSREDYPDRREDLFREDDPAVAYGAQVATHVDDHSAREALTQVLGIARRLRREVRAARFALRSLFREGIERWNAIRDLEDEVATLRADVRVLEQRNHERTVRDAVRAVEAMDAGEDMESVFEDLGRPEGMEQRADREGDDATA